MEKVKFTQSEWDLIIHRLEVPDAIADCLTDHCEGDLPEVEESHDEVMCRVLKIYEEGQDEIDWDSALDVAIIQDAVEAGTILCDLENAVLTGEVSRGTALSMYKAAKGVLEKTGWDFPSW